MTEQLTSTIEAGGLAHLDLRVRVPAAVVGEAYTRVLQNMRREVQVAGYRVGKAPLSAVRQRVGSHISQLVAAQLIKDNADKAARAQGLPPLGRSPESYAVNEAVEGQVFEFRVRLHSICARVTKLDPSYNNLELFVTPRQKDFDTVIEEFLQLFLYQHAESRVRGDDEQVEKGDRVIFSCTVIDDQQPQPEELRNGQTQTIIIGINDTLPGEIARSLHGMCCGDTRRISRIIGHKYDWKNPNTEGQKLTFDLKVHRIEQLLLPELSDELVQRKTGDVPSVEALRNKLKQELMAKESKEREQRLENQVETALLSRSEIEIPQLLLDRVTDSVYRQHTQGNETPLQQQETIRQQCLQQVEETISITAVLEEVARRENIVVRSQVGGTVNDQYQDLRRTVMKHLISHAKVEQDAERLHLLQDKISKRSELKKLADYKNISLKIPLTAARVRTAEQQLESLRHEYASYRISDKPFAPGHDRRIVVTRFVTIDDTPVPDMTMARTTLSLPSEVGEGLPLHMQVFVGMRAGENKKVLCPELFPEAAKRGGKVEIVAILHEMHEMDLPTLDDQFAQEFLDAENMGALHAKISQEVEHSQKQAQRELLCHSIFDKLTDESEFQMDTETAEEAAAVILNSASLRNNFRVNKWLDKKVETDRVRSIVTEAVQHYLITAEIAQRENIAHDDYSDHEDDRVLFNVQEFLLKEAKIVDDSGE